MPSKPEVSLGLALATGTIVYAVHSNLTPPVADIRSLESNNTDIQASERVATWTSAGIVAGISLLAKDPTIFIVGGAVAIALAWTTRHADQVDTVTKKASIMMDPLKQTGSTPSGITEQTVEKSPGLNVGAAYGSSVF